jgi:sugar lactone lactonase YvrE
MKKTSVVSLFAAVLLMASLAGAERLTFTHFAGSKEGGGYVDGDLQEARFSSPQGVAVDRHGVFYVADTGNHTIRRVDTDGSVSTLAGLFGESGSADGPDDIARFSAPSGLALGADGVLYVADTGNHTIRQIAVDGVVTTLAGAPGIAGSADGIGQMARFSMPAALAVDPDGDLIVCDTRNHTIRRISPAGRVSTIAGRAGWPGAVDASGSAARFDRPEGVAVDAAGIIYVADSENNTVRRITTTGEVSTLAGKAGEAGPMDGFAGDARFSHPRGLAVASTGDLLVADKWNHAIRRINNTGEVTTVAAGYLDDDLNWHDLFSRPAGLALDWADRLYVADEGNHAIRVLLPSGMVSTVAGSPARAGARDGSGEQSSFFHPHGLAIGRDSSVIVADWGNMTIRSIDSDGLVTTIAGSAREHGQRDGKGEDARFLSPGAVAVGPDGTLYVTDTWNCTIRKIADDGVVTTMAGSPGERGASDGLGSSARFDLPLGIAVDSAGHVYVADTFNNTVRKITPEGLVTTVAGVARASGFVDGPAASARFHWPHGIVLDPEGNAYVTERGNNRIRRISADGMVTTIAGGEWGDYRDGRGTEARFSAPAGITRDDAGNLYVADSLNGVIRKVSPQGWVTTIGGRPGVAGASDGEGEYARFQSPLGIALNNGALYVADTDNHSIRIGRVPIPDVAVIDAAKGPAWSKRLLDSEPSTATSWNWTVVRRPAGSRARLAPDDARVSSFTPDVPGLFVFRLEAEGARGTSITHVSLMAQPGEKPKRRRAVGRR